MSKPIPRQALPPLDEAYIAEFMQLNDFTSYEQVLRADNRIAKWLNTHTEVRDRLLTVATVTREGVRYRLCAYCGTHRPAHLFRTKPVGICSDCVPLFNERRLTDYTDAEYSFMELWRASGKNVGVFVDSLLAHNTQDLMNVWRWGLSRAAVNRLADAAVCQHLIDSFKTDNPHFMNRKRDPVPPIYPFRDTGSKLVCDSCGKRTANVKNGTCSPCRTSRDREKKQNNYLATLLYGEYQSTAEQAAKDEGYPNQRLMMKSLSKKHAVFQSMSYLMRGMTLSVPSNRDKRLLISAVRYSRQYLWDELTLGTIHDTELWIVRFEIARAVFTLMAGGTASDTNAMVNRFVTADGIPPPRDYHLHSNMKAAAVNSDLTCYNDLMVFDRELCKWAEKNDLLPDHLMKPPKEKPPEPMRGHKAVPIATIKAFCEMNNVTNMVELRRQNSVWADQLASDKKAQAHVFDRVTALSTEKQLNKMLATKHAAPANERCGSCRNIFPTHMLDTSGNCSQCRNDLRNFRLAVRVLAHVPDKKEEKDPSLCRVCDAPLSEYRKKHGHPCAKCEKETKDGGGKRVCHCCDTIKPADTFVGFWCWDCSLDRWQAEQLLLKIRNEYNNYAEMVLDMRYIADTDDRYLELLQILKYGRLRYIPALNDSFSEEVDKIGKYVHEGSKTTAFRRVVPKRAAIRVSDFQRVSLSLGTY